MPSRSVKAESSDEGKTRKSRAPVGIAGGRPSTSSSNSQRRKTVSKPAPSSQYNRRTTQTGGLGGSRASTGRSSIYGQSHSQVKKDPRQLSEKAHQSAAIKKLIGFLSENGYPKTLTPKCLQLPTTKEFLNIFNFLLEMVDPTLVVDGMNITESVPKILKAIRYPFPVSKNHLLNVGSPHSWPILLGALDFLVDVCRIPDRTEEILFGEEFEEGGAEFAMDFNLMSVMYHSYMEYGQDSEEFQNLGERRIQALSEQKDKYQEAVSKCLEEARRLEEAIGELSKSSVISLQESLAQEKAVSEQILASLNSELLPQTHQAEHDITAAESAACQSETQIEEYKRKAEDLEEQIRRQPMSSKEVQDVKQKVREIHQVLDKYRDNVENWKEQIAELQMQHNRTVSGIDVSCGEANDKLRRLAAILPDVGSLAPLDHDTSKRADPEVLQRLVQHAKTLRHELTTLLQKVASHCSDVENKIINGDSVQSTLNSDKVRKQLEIENLEHTLDIEKDALEQKRKMFEDAMKSEQAEKHALEKQLMTLQQRLQKESDAEREHTLVKKQLHDEQVRLERELGEKHKRFIEGFTATTDLIEAVQKHTGLMKQGVDNLVREFKQLKVPTVDPAYLVPVKPYTPSS